MDAVEGAGLGGQAAARQGEGERSPASAAQVTGAAFPERFARLSPAFLVAARSPPQRQTEAGETQASHEPPYRTGRHRCTACV